MESSPVGATFGDDNKEAIRSLFNQPESEQQRLAEEYLQKLFDNAVNPIPISSSQACLDLCYLVDQLRKSNSTILQRLAFSNSTCENLFSFYLEWSERHQQKAMRQVLDLTAALLSSNPDKSDSETTKATILQRIADVISHKASQSMIKPALKALEVFISKKSVSSQQILKSYVQAICEDGGLKFPEKPEPQEFDVLVSAIFRWMRLHDISPAAGRLLVALFMDLRKTYSKQSEHSSHATLWKSWIIHGLCECPDSLENIKNYIFPTLFKLDRTGSVEFLQELTRQSDFSRVVISDLDTNATLLLAAMEIGKVSGLVEDANLNEELMGKSKKRDQILLPEKAIGNLLSHTSSFIRSSALSVMVTSTADTRPLTAETLEFLKQNLGPMHADTDAHFRNNVLSSTRNLLHRLDCAIRYLMDHPKVSSAESTSSTKTNVDSLLEAHLSFKCWYLGFLTEELVPTASYQRHVTALRAIMTLPEMNSAYEHPFLPDRECHIYSDQVTKLSDRVNRLVLNLLADPFEDVRNCSALLLRSVGMNPNIDRKWKNIVVPGSMVWDDTRASLGNNGAVLEPMLIYQFIESTEKVKLRTGRADLADGVARASELLYNLAPLAMGCSAQKYLSNLVSQLEQLIRKAEIDLASAVRLAPVHGEFASIGLIINRLSPEVLALPNKTEEGNYEQKDRWNGIVQRLMACCQDIWNVVEDVLCNDSPEGGSLSDTSEAIDTKGLLSYSFRAVSESSKLMRIMVTKMNLQFADDSRFLEYKHFREIGDLSFTQLASLRHRGAFSAVSLTFAECCQKTQTLSLVRQNSLLHDWYQGTLKCINDQVSTTRRSAGIPALITGILSANVECPSFESVMRDLRRIARRPINPSRIDETNLPQVHAMNSMKEIYKVSALSRKSELCIAVGLELAVGSLQSPIWAIRNCGLILLRSLVDRMLGNNESKANTDAGWDGLSTKLSYDKYEALTNLLVKLLDVDTDNEEDVRSVFPALDIVRRAGPPQQHRNQIYELVSRHLGSRVWLVRDIAARTLCTLTTENWKSSAMELLQSCSKSTNRCHGVLMTLTHLFERFYSSKSPPESELSNLVGRVREMRGSPLILRGSQVVQATYIRLTSAILKLTPDGNQCIQDMALHYRKRAEKGLESQSDQGTLITNHELKSAFLQEACDLQAILTTATSPVDTDLHELVIVVAKGDPEIACTVLENIPSLWSEPLLYTQQYVLEQHAEMYVAVLLKDTPAQVRCVVYKKLAVILDKLSMHGNFNSPSPVVMDQLLLPLENSSSYPDLSNAQIRLSGSLIYRKVKRSSKKENAEQIYAWGEMLRDAGNANNDFDTRIAAVESLAAFYNGFKDEDIDINAFVSSLLAVYDALVDDDDEVRDIAAQIVSKILGGCFIPLAAQKAFFSWLVNIFGSDKFLCKTTMQRLTGWDEGDLESVNSQLARAMQETDTLFVEEEQNLFSDKVRETRIWAEILLSARDPIWKPCLKLLSSYVIKGLQSMHSIIIEKEDGPGGWTSNPEVFAICMRVILTGNALIANYTRVAISPVIDGDEETRKKDEESRRETEITRMAIINAAYRLFSDGSRQHLHESLREEIMGGIRRSGKIFRDLRQVV